MSTHVPTAFFVTGTDTGIGKSVVSAALLACCQRLGRPCLGLKPVASGAMQTADGLRNDDALLLQQYSSVALPYDEINPRVYAPAISPHLAARDAGQTLDIATLAAHCLQLTDQAQGQVTFIEGVGGWHAPLSEQHTVADLALALGLPVILVVGLRLGCLNHAILSLRAIRQSGLPFAGWVANRIDPAMARAEDNLASLQTFLGSPPLAVLPYQCPPNIAQLAGCFAQNPGLSL